MYFSWVEAVIKALMMVMKCLMMTLTRWWIVRMMRKRNQKRSLNCPRHHDCCTDLKEENNCQDDEWNKGLSLPSFKSLLFVFYLSLSLFLFPFKMGRLSHLSM